MSCHDRSFRENQIQTSGHTQGDEAMCFLCSCELFVPELNTILCICQRLSEPGRKNKLQASWDIVKPTVFSLSVCFEDNYIEILLEI